MVSIIEHIVSEHVAGYNRKHLSGLYYCLGERQS